MSHEWIIRMENNVDYDSIDRIVVAASGERETADLVRKLRSEGDALLSLVAESQARLVGHIMMSRMSIETPSRDVAAVALAPLMVDPAYQNRGIGTLLTRNALKHCRDSGENIVLVLGHPTYYPRFGFMADVAEHLQIPFKLTVPGAFMGLELKPGALSGVHGRVKYPKAFALPPDWTTPSLVAIRRFEDGDEIAAVEVWFRSGRAAYPFLPMWQTFTQVRAVEIFRNEIRSRCDIWVAVRGGQLIGYIAMRGSYIDHLYVDPDAQRRSYGTLLLNFAKRISPGGLQLHTHQQNLPARAFYEKHGFHAVQFGTSPPPESAPNIEYHWNRT